MPTQGGVPIAAPTEPIAVAHATVGCKGRAVQCGLPAVYAIVSPKRFYTLENMCKKLFPGLRKYQD